MEPHLHARSDIQCTLNGGQGVVLQGHFLPSPTSSPHTTLLNCGQAKARTQAGSERLEMATAAKQGIRTCLSHLHLHSCPSSEAHRLVNYPDSAQGVASSQFNKHFLSTHYQQHSQRVMVTLPARGRAEAQSLGRSRQHSRSRPWLSVPDRGQGLGMVVAAQREPSYLC